MPVEAQASQIWSEQPLGGGCTGLWESQAPQADFEDLSLVAAPEWLGWPVAPLPNAAANLHYALWPLQYKADNVQTWSWPKQCCVETVTVGQESTALSPSATSESAYSLHRTVVVLWCAHGSR